MRQRDDKFKWQKTIFADQNYFCHDGFSAIRMFSIPKQKLVYVYVNVCVYVYHSHFKAF